MFTNGFGGFPFSAFMGGGQENMQDENASNSEQEKNVDNESFYKILELPKNATTEEIKKKYRQKCVKGDYRHPDRGGDQKKYMQLQEAYEVLVNPETRDLYDRGGMDAVKRGKEMGDSDFTSIFDLFGGGGGRKPKGPMKMKAKLKEVTVTLEDVYKGKMMHVEHKRKRVCKECNGKGGENVKQCGTCKGKKIIVKMVQLGPGMYTQTQAHCTTCKGEGNVMDEKDRCKVCKGEKIIDDVKVLEFTLEPGCPDSHDYILSGESDEVPGVDAGDLYCRIKIEKHKDFVRKGADLFYEKKIPLLQALTGCHFTITHLDGQQLTIATKPNEVISHEEVKTVKGKGMPFYKDAFSQGNLYIVFKVEFPKRGQLKKEQIEALKKILPGNVPKPIDKNAQVEYLEDFHEHETNSNPTGGKDHEEDDEQGEGGKKVVCHQQ